MGKTYFDIYVIKKYLKAAPELLYDIKNILNYRNLRSEQAFYAKAAYEYDHTEKIFGSRIIRDATELDRSYWQDRIQALDRRRRDTHNKALASFNNIVQTGLDKGLDYIYTGPRLTGDEAALYLHAERRAEITDAMFESLAVIENAAIDKSEQAPESVTLGAVQTDMNSFNRAYHIKKSLKSDESSKEDGGIEFDFQPINNLNNNENL